MCTFFQAPECSDSSYKIRCAKFLLSGELNLEVKMKVAGLMRNCSNSTGIEFSEIKSMFAKMNRDQLKPTLEVIYDYEVQADMGGLKGIALRAVCDIVNNGLIPNQVLINRILPRYFQ